MVNDVKVNHNATVAVITREGASDRKNGIVVLDLADPAHPAIADTYTKDLSGGVHNVFFWGDILYAIHNGTLDVHILDISDPRDVEEVGRWGIEKPGKYLHDIWVVDGLAYVSYWNDGVYILDVGDGRWGGRPTAPVEVSSFAYEEGNTHVAFPYTNADGHTYLFVGDEIFDCEDCISRNGVPGDGSRGFIHVLDMADPGEAARGGALRGPRGGRAQSLDRGRQDVRGLLPGRTQGRGRLGRAPGRPVQTGTRNRVVPDRNAGRTCGQLADGVGTAAVQGPRVRVGPELGALGVAGWCRKKKAPVS